MKLEIHYRDMTSTEGIKNHIEQATEKLHKFQKDDELIRFVVGARGIRQYAEIYWHDKGEGKDFFAKQEGDDLYAQIDQVVDKIIHQLQKAHDKTVDRHHRKEPLKRLINS